MEKPMTMEQALQHLKMLLPEKAERLTVEHGCKIGYDYGSMNMYYLWDHSDPLHSVILGDSTESFEQAFSDMFSKLPVGVD